MINDTTASNYLFPISKAIVSNGLYCQNRLTDEIKKCKTCKTADEVWFATEIPVSYVVVHQD